VLIRHHMAMMWPNVKFWMKNLTDVPNEFLYLIQVPPIEYLTQKTIIFVLWKSPNTVKYF
jgi:hypothetical protein